MGLMHWLKRMGDGNRHVSKSQQSQVPVFEQLEPRLLLSADASSISDIHLSDTQEEQVISADFEPGYAVIQDAGEDEVEDKNVGNVGREEEKTEDSWTVGQSDSLTVKQSDRLLVSQIEAASNLGVEQEKEIRASPADASEAVEPNTEHRTPMRPSGASIPVVRPLKSYSSIPPSIWIFSLQTKCTPTSW